MTPATHHAFRLQTMYCGAGALSQCRKFGLPTMRREGVRAALALISKYPAAARGSLGIHVTRALRQPLQCGKAAA